MAADFEFLDGGDLTQPFKNKKLQPFMIAGVVGVVAFVLFRKSGGSNEAQTETAYQATYGNNTGTTTEVSNMLEDYKTTVSEMLTANAEMQEAQMESYMEQLNSMHDAKMEAFDYEMKKQQEALEKQIADNQAAYNQTVSNLNSQIADMQAQAQERAAAQKAAAVVKNYYDTPSNNTSKKFEDYNVTNGRESNYLDDGSAYLTQGLFDMTADISGTRSSSSSDFKNASTKYYYEDSSGKKYDSAVQKWDQNVDAKGNVTNTLYFEDGTSKVVSSKLSK